MDDNNIWILWLIFVDLSHQKINRVFNTRVQFFYCCYLLFYIFADILDNYSQPQFWV